MSWRLLTGPLAHRYVGEMAMNWDRLQGNGEQFKGRVREKWAKLTDDLSMRMRGTKINAACRTVVRFLAATTGGIQWWNHSNHIEQYS
jgi:hypothetical protein